MLPRTKASAKAGIICLVICEPLRGLYPQTYHPQGQCPNTTHQMLTKELRKGLWEAALRTCSCGHCKNPQQELGPPSLFFFPQGQFWIKIFFWICNQTFSSGLGARFDPWFSEMCICLSFQTLHISQTNLGKCKPQFKRLIWTVMPTCIGNLLKKSNIIGSFPALTSAVNTSFSQTANSWEH